MRSSIAIVLLVVCSCIFSSCFFYGKTKVYDTIEGINSDAASDSLVNCMIIHGIGIKDSNYADLLIANLCNELKVDGIQLNHKVKIRNNFNSSLNLKADSGCIYFLEGKARNTAKRYRFFVIHWSPITYAFKNELKNFDFDKQRSKLFLRKNKRKIMNENLSDVAAYMNPDYKDYIQKLVEQAFILMFHKDPSKANSPIYILQSLNVLSGSFGSRIVLDVFNKNLEWMQKSYSQLSPEEQLTDRYLEKLKPGFKKDIEKFLVQQPINFYMLSNQLPLFTIFNSHKTNPQLASQSRDSLNEYERLYSNIRKSEYSIKQIVPTTQPDSVGAILNKQLIIFNDPNDFLGYRVRKEIFGKDSSGKFIYDVRNVSMRNTPVLIPGILKFSNPGKAHELAFKNRDLHQIIAKGKCRNHAYWYNKSGSH